MGQQINNIIAKMQINNRIQRVNYKSEAERFAEEPFHISIPNAEELLRQGIKALWGDKGEWLNGYDVIVKWLMNSNYKWLLIKGNLGRGKTDLMEYIIHNIIKPYYAAKMFNYFPKKAFPIIYPETMFLIEKSELMRELNSPFFTAFDDVGKEYDKFDNRRKNIFKDLVRSAYESRKVFPKTLIMTTNLCDDEITTNYGSDVLSRLNEMSVTAIVVGEDMR